MTLYNPPIWPPPVEAVRTRLISNRGLFRSPVTGNTQAWSRPGARWEFDIRFHVLSDTVAWQWRGFLAQLQDEGASVRWGPYPQGRPISYSSGTGWGTPLVNGGSQTGRSLVTDGWTAGATIKKGDFVSTWCPPGNLMLFQVTADVTANGSGQATIAISPPLPSSPDDNQFVFFDGHASDPTLRAACQCIVDPDTPIGWDLEQYNTRMAFRLIEAWP